MVQGHVKKKNLISPQWLRNLKSKKYPYWVEDLLAKNLPRERWGWAAIHLCNLYTGKLNQPEKGLELLRRVRDEYGDTPAGEKASARLLQIE